MTEPAYIQLSKDGELRRRAEQALALLSPCRLCPRECKVDRLNGETGFCNTGRDARVASYSPHFGEETPLVGEFGSGTIFISSCNLLCGFCQNYEISHLNEGKVVTPSQMADIMVHLAERGCHNINFVTPTHVIPQILEALCLAVERGLKVPLIYNSSGYERKETLQLLEGVFDIYMPDFKFWEDKWSERFCRASDYRDKAIMAIKEMHRQVGDLTLDSGGIATKGLLVRHLVMPNNLASTEKISRFLAEEISPETYVNVMDQYRPCGVVGDDDLVNRSLTAQEYSEALEMAKRAGLRRLDQRERLFLFFK